MKKTIIISGINFFEGGPLSVFKDCLDYVNTSKFQNNFKFIALVHKKELFDQNYYSNIEFLEFPKSRKSYFYRLYFEYFYFKKIAVAYNVNFWFSMHDITPSIGKIPQAVYCHNPSPFNSINIVDLYIQPTQFLFRLFYKFLYQINIKKNKYVVVQQLWIKDKFSEMFRLNRSQIMVAPPQIPEIPIKYLNKTKQKIETETTKVFFFPTFSRPFKNIEVICEAVKLVLLQNNNSFKVLITINGSENNYAKSIFNKYNCISNIDFIGLMNRESVYEQYAKSDYLIFPSKLETWGLPISEFKQFKKPMLVSNLPYAKETVGDYKFVNFFDVNNPNQLASLMIGLLKNEASYDKTAHICYEEPFAKDWHNLFNYFLNE
jgi:glycosyltransferase involved in cell wall biosynthesis